MPNWLKIFGGGLVRMLRIGSKKNKTAQAGSRKDSIGPPLCFSCSGEEVVKMRLETGKVVLNNAPSGQLPRDVIEEEAAEKDPVFREILRKRKIDSLKNMLRSIESG
jgi:hypothetical protein